MVEWLGPDNLEDPENTTQDLLNELANESDEIASQVEIWPVGVEVGNVRKNAPTLLKPLEDKDLNKLRENSKHRH